MGYALTLLLCVVTKQVGEQGKGRENVSHVSNLGRVCSGGTGATDDRPFLTRNQKLHMEYGVGISSHSDTVIVRVLRIFKQ